MTAEEAQLSGPDFTQGIEASRLADGTTLLGYANGEAVLLARRGSEIFAIGAICTHYNGPLAEGLLVDDTVRCPWHHACFSLRTGEALRAPALNPVACWKVELADGKVFVREKAKRQPAEKRAATAAAPRAIVIVGGGAAGNAAAEMLRREGFGGSITMPSADDAAPYDRPNLSKDFLAGKAPEDWIPLRSPDFYKKKEIDVRLNAAVASIDTAGRAAVMSDGSRVPFDALLLATGARVVRLDVPGADLPHVHYLRTLDDSTALIAAAERARRVVVIGASFIGLETAAALRERGLEVHVVGPQARPLERVLGPELGDMVKAIHEEHGVVFHFNTSATAIDREAVTLKSGERIAADLVVAGIGVRPETGLAEQARLKVDNGVLVDAYLEASAPGIFAAGDIARWPDLHTGKRIRVEHWVVAERQGQTAARNMLGRREAFDAVPFFWSQHYDLQINYVGHAEGWDRIEIEGKPADRNCAVSYFAGGRKVAVATVARDLDSLRAEVELEHSRA
jgi:NADPH-dependent 2,4-dienoyl-CoA reductase/sulfur reductase-like enzyme/nitrite reductase/ring-hydroxylating ferredoxin subunit